MICDVEGELYKALGPGSAADREEFLGSAIIAAETVAKEADLVHGEDLGNPLQYPGCLSSPRTERSAMPSVQMPLSVGLPSLADVAREAGLR